MCAFARSRKPWIAVSSRLFLSAASSHMLSGHHNSIFPQPPHNILHVGVKHLEQSLKTRCKPVYRGGNLKKLEGQTLVSPFFRLGQAVGHWCLSLESFRNESGKPRKFCSFHPTKLGRHYNSCDRRKQKAFLLRSAGMRFNVLPMHVDCAKKSFIKQSNRRRNTNSRFFGWIFALTRSGSFRFPMQDHMRVAPEFA